MNRHIRTLLASAAIPVSCIALTPEAHAYFSGADIGWMSQEQASGAVWKNSSGTATSPYTLLKNLGVTVARLRVWVNPSGGYCNVTDTIAKAKLAVAAGMAIDIDFHYSDTWADPGHQTEPAAWKGQTLAQLETDVTNFTTSALNSIKSAGITVTYVEDGNEINSGLLWPIGSTSSGFGNIAGLLNAGYNATKAVFPSAKVIVHLANGYNTSDFTWFFSSLKKAGGKWDIVGMSHYPTASNWTTLTSELNTTAKTMISDFGTPVVVAETGMSYNNPTAANAMIAALTADIYALGSNGIGVFYWEPEAQPGWQGYEMGATGTNDEFTAAMDHL